MAHLRLLWLGLLLLAGSLAAQDSIGPAETGAEVVKVSMAWSQEGVASGGQILLAVIFDIDPRWHIQIDKPQKEWLRPTKVTLEGLPPSVLAGDVQYPEPHTLDVDLGDGPEKLDFYVGKAVIFQKLKVGADVAPGQYSIRINAHWQACDDKVCLAPTITPLSVTLNVMAIGAKPVALNPELFAQYQAGRVPSLQFDLFNWKFTLPQSNLAAILLVAAIGGLLLNLTPCVLPMVPIKIMGLSRMAGNRGRCFVLGLVMSGGVVAFWLGLAVAIAAVSGFTSTNQLFQYPAFTIGVGLVIAAMAVGMFGLFTMNLPQWVTRIRPSQESLHGSFGFGIMTAVLSTPCTAPFMGAAAAWAATQAPAITLATFGAIGLGMALPYLVLAAFPALVKHMPRTGPASELIKQVMGLLMLSAAAYFVGTGVAGILVQPPDPPTLAYWWGVGLFMALAGAWLVWRTFAITSCPGCRALFGALGILGLAAGVMIGTRLTDQGPVHWIYYTEQRLEEARAEKKIVVLEFTAQWCLNCHALERAVLHRPEVAEALNSPNVAPIKVDLTGKNEAGNKKLLAVGRRTIPLLVIYDRQGKELFQSDAYTRAQVLEALARAAAVAPPASAK